MSSGIRKSLNFKIRRATVSSKELPANRSSSHIPDDVFGRQSANFGVSPNTFSNSKLHKTALAHYCKSTLTNIGHALGLEQQQIDDMFMAFDTVLTEDQHRELQSRRISPLLPPTVEAIKRVDSETSLYLKYQAHARKIVMIQSLFRGRLTRRWVRQYAPERSDIRRYSIRNRAFMTLISAEREYLKTLTIITDKFLKPLRNQHVVKSVDVQKIVDIFSNLETIKDEHCSLLTKLEASFLLESSSNNWPFFSNIGESLLLAFQTLLPAYGVYTETATLQQLENDQPFQNFLQLQTSGGVPIRVLLQAPLNHIGNRVRPALISIFENSRDTDEGYSALESALQVIQQTSEYILTSIDDAPKRAFLLNAVRRIHSDHPLNLMVKGRSLVREGPVSKVDSIKKDPYLMLFNDVLVVGELQSHAADHINMKKIIYLSAKVVLDQMEGEKSKSKGSKSIKIESPDGVMTIVFRSVPEKLAWVAEFMLVLDVFEKSMVFGAHLDKVPLTEGESLAVPVVMKQMIDFLSNDEYLSKEGLFRVAGKKVVIDTLKSLYDNGKTQEIEWDTVDVHAVACLLKMWFRELPEPLFPYDTYDKMVEMQMRCENEGFRDPTEGAPGFEQYMAKIATHMTALSPLQLTVFQCLFEFLKKVSLFSELNKMHSKNLAVVFAPNLLRPEHDTVQTALQSPQVTSLVKVMIDHYPLLLQLLNDPSKRESWLQGPAAAPLSKPVTTAPPPAIKPVPYMPPPATPPPPLRAMPAAMSRSATLLAGAPALSALPHANSTPVVVSAAVAVPPPVAKPPPPVAVPPPAAILPPARVPLPAVAPPVAAVPPPVAAVPPPVTKPTHQRTASGGMRMLLPNVTAKRCKAKFKYQGQNAKDLSLEKGDIITILDDTGDWWRGQLPDGRTGLFPSNYVRMLKPKGAVP